MILTRIWSAILVLLATVFLAGMFILTHNADGEFSDAERASIRGITDGGLVAFEADIASSPVSQAPQIMADSRMKDALDPDPDAADDDDDDEAVGPEGLESTFAAVANEGLLKDFPLMSLALVDKSGAPIAKTGVDERLFEELVDLDAYKSSLTAKDEDLFSAALGGKLFAVKISRKEIRAEARRVVAIRALDLGGTSFLRRVLGDNPAGLVRDGQVLGEPIGSADANELVKLVTENRDSLPSEGASVAVEVGEGASKRICSIGRVPGPAGKGESPTVFAVLSKKTAGSGSKDLATALGDANKAGGMAQVVWPVVLGLLVIGLALSVYLPHLEGVAPTKRLAAEFHRISEGNQSEVNPETYAGALGEVARNAVKAHETMRVTWAEELENADGEGTGGRRLTRSVRSVRRRSTRSNKVVDSAPEPEETPGAIELPDADDVGVERHSHADPGGGGAEGGEPPPTFPDPNTSGSGFAKPGESADGAPVPTLTDTVVGEEDGDGISLGGLDAPKPGGSGDREAYFREVFEEFVALKEKCGESTRNFGYEKFATKLRKNTADLMARAGTVDVKFTVYEKDGRAALKAKIIK